MRTSAFITSGFIVLVVGCGSGSRSAYEALADDLNPILVTLNAKIAAIATLAPTALRNGESMFQLCANADAELDRLATVKLDHGLRLDPVDETLPSFAGRLASDRRSPCDPRDQGDRGRRCAWFCLGAWRVVAQGLRRMSAVAAEQGVSIYSVPDVPEPNF